mmetsp:Transcript_36895/g.61610  ORF Transcript_36895/g.61610 Transcript_36895/m.61610 type:complete len:396 (-) Transcript_36895:311-1498(-)
MGGTGRAHPLCVCSGADAREAVARRHGIQCSLGMAPAAGHDAARHGEVAGLAQPARKCSNAIDLAGGGAGHAAAGAVHAGADAGRAVRGRHLGLRDLHFAEVPRLRHIAGRILGHGRRLRAGVADDARRALPDAGRVARDLHRHREPRGPSAAHLLLEGVVQEVGGQLHLVPFGDLGRDAGLGLYDVHVLLQQLQPRGAAGAVFPLVCELDGEAGPVPVRQRGKLHGLGHLRDQRREVGVVVGEEQRRAGQQLRGAPQQRQVHPPEVDGGEGIAADVLKELGAVDGDGPAHNVRKHKHMDLRQRLLAVAHEAQLVRPLLFPLVRGPLDLTPEVEDVLLDQALPPLIPEPARRLGGLVHRGLNGGAEEVPAVLGPGQRVGHAVAQAVVVRRSLQGK